MAPFRMTLAYSALGLGEGDERADIVQHALHLALEGNTQPPAPAEVMRMMSPACTVTRSIAAIDLGLLPG